MLIAKYWNLKNVYLGRYSRIFLSYVFQFLLFLQCFPIHFHLITVEISLLFTSFPHSILFSLYSSESQASAPLGISSSALCLLLSSAHQGVHSFYSRLVTHLYSPVSCNVSSCNNARRHDHQHHLPLRGQFPAGHLYSANSRQFRCTVRVELVGTTSAERQSYSAGVVGVYRLRLRRATVSIFDYSDCWIEAGWLVGICLGYYELPLISERRGFGSDKTQILPLGTGRGREIFLKKI